MAYTLNRLWNPKTQKGVLAAFASRGKAVNLVVESLQESDEFFADVEQACDDDSKGREAAEFRRGRNEARLDVNCASAAPELAKDRLSLPLQRLRESISEMIKTSDDKECGEELIECNRRLAELREEVK